MAAVLLHPALSRGSESEPDATPPPAAIAEGSGDTSAWPATAEPHVNEMRGECPTDATGSLADAWQWQPTKGELELLAIDLEGDGTLFRAMGEMEGTSMIIKVKRADTEENIGVIKTSSSNTRTWAEVYAHRLSTYLGFGDLVPDVAHVELGVGALEKIIAVLEGTRFADDAKERRRQRVLREVRAAQHEGTVFVGAMKPWLSAFMFHGGLGQRDSLAAHPVMQTLRARGDQPTDEPVELRQFTRLYEPRGTYIGELTMAQLASDLSSIMLMDALMAQNDRFPGANLHFISTEGTREDSGERRGYPIFSLGAVRLLALDNGAALRSENGSGLSDLAGSTTSGTRVERFDRHAVERLRALARRWTARGCDEPPFDDEVAAIDAYFGLDAERGAIARRLLERVLDYVDGLEQRHGDAIYLERSRESLVDNAGALGTMLTP